MAVRQLAGEARRLFWPPLPRGAPGPTLRPRKGPARFSAPVLGEGPGREGLEIRPFYRLPSGFVFSPVPALGRRLGVWALKIRTARRGARAGRPLSLPPITYSLSPPSLPREWGMGTAHLPEGGTRKAARRGAQWELAPAYRPVPLTLLSRRRRQAWGQGQELEIRTAGRADSPESCPAGRAVGDLPPPIARFPLLPCPGAGGGPGAWTRAENLHCQKGGEPGKPPCGGSGGGLAPACRLVSLAPCPGAGGGLGA